MRSGNVLYNGILAGTIVETDDGEYVFSYDKNYTHKYDDQFISFNMPVREEPFISNRLFPFFIGLIPEGWLLEIASKSWKINRNDKMGLLLACCRNCIGAVSIEPINIDDEQ